jgi:serine/threonine-protein kinase
MADDPITGLNAALEGRYRIERKLGEGGMATVYLAEDLRHDRKVAVKFLKPELAAVVGADRFLSEIKTTANLQHPHILPLFDSGEADGHLFYVMPYVEGETLRERIDRDKQLPIDEALGIATAVANALQTAHDAGVVHRDIKPGNILLSRGEPLVADFGIALAVGAAGGNRLTETGLSVGTPFYMSPEQATGDQAVGPASDTYALACVLYEMLVGEPPYLGNTAQAVLGKIIQGLPVSASEARKSIPANVDAAIRKALEKLPADRFTGAGQFARALADSSFSHGEDLAGPMAGDARRWKRLAAGAGAVAVVAIVVAVMGIVSPPAQSSGVLRQKIAPFAEGMARPLGAFSAFAPDGSSMVYARPDGEGDTWHLWLKPRDAAEATLLPGTEGAQNVTYSPDGLSIAFASRSELKVRPVGDGSTVTIAEGLSPGAASMVALAWLDDGTILFELPTSTLMRIPAGGGEAVTVVAYPEMGYPHVSHAVGLPGSKGALVAICPTENCQNGSELGALDFEADTTRILVDDAARGWYTPTGHVVYVRTDGAVFAAPFDLDAMELTGPGIPLFEGVIINASAPEMAVSWDGTVVYASGSPPEEGGELVWVNRTGGFEPVDPGMQAALMLTVALSPTDDRVAVSMAPLGSPGTVNQEIWVKELPSGPLTRLTTGEGFTRRPAWSPDGRTIAYVTQDTVGGRTKTVRADGSSAGRSEVLLEAEGGVWEVFFTQGGTELLYRRGGANVGQADIGRVALDSRESPEDLLATGFNEFGMSLSPDERWMAYTSSSSGDFEVFVRPYPDMSTRVQVSTDGGTNAVWGHNGRELFYIGGDGWLWSATYAADSDFSVTGRERLFDASGFYRFSDQWRGYDVTSDDERFLMIRPLGQTQLDVDFVYVQNYWDELRERVGG